MSKMLIPILIAALLLAASALMAGKPLNKTHKGLKGKDDAKVNCAYCHKKAGNPKTKGNDLAKIKQGPYCAIEGCHK